MDSKVKVLESRVRELERALDIEKKQAMETQRQLYKRDRKIKELGIEVEDYKIKFKDAEKRFLDLESELRTHRRKFDEVSEISTLNQNRFRKVHQMYINEVGKSEQFEEQLRRRRAVDNRTPYFVQV